MLTVLGLFKKECMAAASRLGDINNFEQFPKDETLLANGYLEADVQGNKVLAEAYIAALILRHWKDINKLYKKCFTCDNKNTIEDFAMIVYDRIIYAMQYKAWLDGSKTAQQCINQTLATEVTNQFYFSNLAKNKANANTYSLDNTVKQDQDGHETALIDTIVDENSTSDTSGADGLIQMYVNRKKLIEAVILDTIANQDSSRVIKETETYIDSEGNEQKISVSSREFWPYVVVKALNALDANEYIDYFIGKYKAKKAEIQPIVESIKTTRNQKLYKSMDKVLTELRNNPALVQDMLMRG